jgi:hypothetical protein
MGASLRTKFVALLDHFSPANKQFVLNAYLKYFISLAEIEEQASLYVCPT